MYISVAIHVYILTTDIEQCLLYDTGDLTYTSPSYIERGHIGSILQYTNILHIHVYIYIVPVLCVCMILNQSYLSASNISILVL